MNARVWEAVQETVGLFKAVALAAVLTLSLLGAVSANEVNVDITPPTVTNVTSNVANDIYKTGAVIPVRVTFSEVVTYTPGSGVAQFQLETGTIDSQVAYTSGSGSTTLIFNYTVALGDSSPDLDYVSTGALTLIPSATIKDAAGNNAVLTLPAPGTVGSLGFNKFIEVDGIPPTVASVNRLTPVAQRTTAASVTWRVTFSEYVDAATVSASDFTLTDVSSSVTGESITSTTPTFGGSTTIDVTVNTGSGDGTLRLDVQSPATISDLAGNDYGSSFMTGQTYIIDRTAPTVTAVERYTPTDEYTNDAFVTWRVKFSETVNATTVGTADFVLVDVSSTITGESKTSTSPTTKSTDYIDVTVNTGTGDGTLQLNVLAAATIQDLTGNDYNSNYTSGQTYKIDKTAPFVTSITRNDPSEQYTHAAQVTWSVQCNELIDMDTVSISDFTLTDVSGTITGESITSVSPGETGDAPRYINVTANTGSGDGTLRLDVLPAAAFCDYAGNDCDSNFTIGMTYIIDYTPPTVLSVNRLVPTDQRTNDFEVTWRVTFNETIDASTLDAPDLTKTKTGSITGDTITEINPNDGPSATVDITLDTGSGNGTICIDILSAATIQDLSGNDYNSNFTSGQSYIIDKTPPTVTINQAAGQADPTNTSPVQFRVVFSEAVTTFGTGDVTLSGTAGATTAVVTDSGDHITYTVAVSGMTGIGTVIAQVQAGRAIDLAGNSNAASTSTDNQVTFDNVGPTVTINKASGQADPTNGSPIQFTVVFSEAVTGFETGDLALSGTAGATNAVVTDTGDHVTYTVDVSGMTGDGTVTAGVVAGAVTDALGNPSSVSTSADNTVIYDTVGPTVTIDQAEGQGDPTGGSQINFTTVFSEVVTDFDPADVTLTGGAHPTTAAIIDMGEHKTYKVEVTGMTSQGGVIAKLLAGVAHDAAGNPNAASTSTDNSVIYDSVAPTVTVNKATSQPDPAKAAPINFVVVFSEPVSDFTAEDVTLWSAASSATATVMGSGKIYSIAVTGTIEQGVVAATIGANAAHDAAGNGSLASTSTDNIVVYDSVGPTVEINQDPSQVDPTGSSPVNFRVHFGEPVSDFTANEVTLSGTACPTTAAITWFDAYTFTVAVSGMSHTGTVVATIPSGVAHDAAGNANRGSTSVDNTVTIILALENLSISPSGGSLGTSPITIATVYRDTAGYSDIKKAFLLINDSWSQANAVLLYYDRVANRVYLKNDANTSWGTGYAPGTAVTLENSQCFFYVAETSAADIGDLAVNWRVALKSPFDIKLLNGYMYMQNVGGVTRGWDLRGIYYGVKPLAVSITPNDEVLPIDEPIFLKSLYRDPNGYADIRKCYMLICENFSQANAMFLCYDRPANRLYLKNDANTSWGSGYALGADITLENSQCIVYVKDITPEIVGNDLTLMWVFRLKPSMTGKNLYSWMYVTDAASLYDGWKKMGTHFTPLAPVCVSVTPSTGDVQTETPLVFTTEYSDGNGYSDIGTCYLQMSVTSSQANAVFLLYDTKQDKLFLRNDANTSWGVGYAPGTNITLENSQCIVYVKDVLVAPNGTEGLLLDWKIALKASYAGQLLAQRMFCRDNENLNSGWKLKGYVRGQ